MGDIKNKLDKLASPQNDEWRVNVRNRKENNKAFEWSTKIILEVLDVLEAQGLNQTDLGERMGVTRQQVSKLLRGKQTLSLETIAKLEEALDINLIEIGGHVNHLSSEMQSWQDLIISKHEAYHIALHKGTSIIYSSDRMQELKKAFFQLEDEEAMLSESKPNTFFNWESKSRKKSKTSSRMQSILR